MFKFVPNDDVDIEKDIKLFKKYSGCIFLGTVFMYIVIKKMTDYIIKIAIQDDIPNIIFGITKGIEISAYILLILTAVLHLFFISIFPKLIEK